MNDNPYSTPSLLSDENASPSEQRRLLWLAYLFAPATAPITFVVLIFVAGPFATKFGIHISPANFLSLPLIAMAAGMPICYVVAGCIGMPIVFGLQKRRILNGRTIYTAAFALSIFLSLIFGVPAAIYFNATWYQIPLGPLLLLPFITPPTLVSGTVFWGLLKIGGGLSISSDQKK